MTIKRMLAVVMVLCMVIPILPVTASASQTAFVDFPTGWSAEAMTAAVNNGLLRGVSDTEIRPTDYLTRAEFATIVARAFGATAKADISAYTDVLPSAWYYAEIAKAVQMQAMQGTGATTMDPEANITREEAFTALARVLVLESADYGSLSKFVDQSGISSWATPYLAAMAARGYINGDESGRLNPSALITREEFAQVMHNMIRVYITESGAYASNYGGITVVRAGNVTLNGATVSGDLVIGDGAGTDAVNLTNTAVQGRLLVRGGTMKLSGTTTGAGVVVKNVNGITNFQNYKTEAVFSNITELTQTQFLTAGGSTKPGGSGGGGGGGGGSSSSSTYSVTFYVNNTEYEKVTGIAYGKTVGDKMPRDPKKDGYRFLGWQDENGSDFSATKKIYSNIKVYAQWEGEDVAYQVKHYLENANNAEYTLDATDNATGKAGEQTAAVAKTTYTDYEVQSFNQATIAADGSTVVNIYYKRKTFTLTFDANGGTGGSSTQVKWGASITAPVVSRPSHQFTGWNPAVPSEMPKESVTYVAQWTVLPPTTAQYTVIHYLENANDEQFTEADRTTESGTIGEQTAAVAKTTYTDYEVQSFNQETIAADGSTVVNIYYKRKTFTLTFDANGGTGGSSTQVKWGASITAPVVSRHNHQFTGWNPAVPSEMPKESVTYVAQWTALPPNSHLVTFKKNETDTTAYAEFYVTDGESIGSKMPAEPSQVGSVFKRWKDENGISVTAETIVNGTMLIIAEWEPQTFTVRFFKDARTTSQLGDAITVSYGDTLAYSAYPATAIAVAENSVQHGYTKPASWASFYNDEQHDVYGQFWYYNTATGDWEVFDETVAVKQDIDVHFMFRRISFTLNNSRLPQPITLNAHYVPVKENGIYHPNSAVPTRIMDTVKDLSAGLVNQMEPVVQQSVFADNEQKLFDKLEAKGLITADRSIKITNVPISITTVIQTSEIEKEVEQYVKRTIFDASLQDSIFNLMDIGGFASKYGVEKVIPKLSHAQIVTLLQDDTVYAILEPYLYGMSRAYINEEFVAANRALIDEKLTEPAVSDSLAAVITTDMVKSYINSLEEDEKEAFAQSAYTYLADSDAYKNFMGSFVNGDESFTVREEDTVFALAMAGAVESFSYEGIKDKIDNAAFKKLIDVTGETFIKKMFNTARDSYVSDLRATVSEVEADGVARDCSTALTFKVNAVDILEKVYAKAQAVAENKIAAFPVIRYAENEYLQWLVQHNPIEELLVVSGSETDTLTGYQFKNTADAADYFEYMQKLLVIGDDAFTWYGDTDNLSEEELTAIVDAAYGKFDTAQATLNELLEAFATDGTLPAKVQEALSNVAQLNALIVQYQPQMAEWINRYLESDASDIGSEKLERAVAFVTGTEDTVSTVDLLYSLFYKAEDKVCDKLQSMIDDGTLQKAFDKLQNTSIAELVRKLGNETATSYAEKLDEIKNTGRVQSAFDSVYDLLVMMADQGIEVFKAPQNTNPRIVVVDAYEFNIRGVKITVQRDMY